LYVKRVALPLRNKLLISASLRPNITQHFEWMGSFLQLERHEKLPWTQHAKNINLLL
jgi:hypothetical protein